MRDGILGKRLPLVLSPMVDVTDAAFRSIASEWGADVTCSEMVAAVGLVNGSEKAWKHLAPYPGESPYGVQFMCGDPAEMGQAVRTLATRIQPEFVDVNLGCPAPNILKSCAGGFLLRDPPLAGKVVAAARQAADEAGIPHVSAKMRLGPSASRHTYLQVAEECVAAGASWLTLHARTVEQGYSGVAEWEHIARLVDHVDVPVIGNGDLRTPPDVVRMKEETDCAGFFIARAAMHDPTVFRRMRAALDAGPATDPAVPAPVESSAFAEPAMRERLLTLLAYLDRAPSAGVTGIGDLRRQATRFVAGGPGAKKLRVAFQTAADDATLRTLAAEALAQMPPAP